MTNKPTPTRSTMDSVKSLFSLETIPMLIAQGVPGKLLPVGTMIIGLILGFLWAYGISPNVYTAAEPVNLGQSWKQAYIKQIAWQYSAATLVDPTAASDEAKRQLSYIGDATTVYNTMLQTETDPNLVQRLQALQPFVADNPAVLTKVQPSLLNSNLTPFLCVLAMALVIGIPVLINVFIPFKVLFAPRSKTPSTVVEGQEAERRKAMKEAQEKAKTATPVPAAAVAAVANLGEPVTRMMSTYLMGDDLYDDSFSIETQAGAFLGEMGGSISKTIGVGDPKKVTAVEVWVFDKDDIRTVTKVLMSENAFNDEALRTELSTKGDCVIATPGSVITLETQSLIVNARLVDMSYGSGALPTNSFFDRISIELSAYRKSAGAAPATPPAAPPTNDAFGQTGPTPIKLK